MSRLDRFLPTGTSTAKRKGRVRCSPAQSCRTQRVQLPEQPRATENSRFWHAGIGRIGAQAPLAFGSAACQNSRCSGAQRSSLFPSAVARGSGSGSGLLGAGDPGTCSGAALRRRCRRLPARVARFGGKRFGFQASNSRAQAALKCPQRRDSVTRE